MSILSVGEPSPEVDAPQEGTEQANPPQGESTVEEVAQSSLPDDTEVEIQLADGTTQTVKLADLRQNYVDRDRHRKAADQKFTEADKKLKGAVGAAISDPKQFLKFVEENRKDFKALDFFFKELEDTADPVVIDRLAALLTKKLESEKAENEMSPEAKRVRELERQNKELQDRWEAQQDQREEQALFDGVKSAVEAAGLNPSPLVAMMALEIVAEARAAGENLTTAEAAELLKHQFRSAAEGLFKPQAAEGEGKAIARDPATGQFQAKAKQSPGVADSGAAAAAKRQAPRVTVTKPGAKKPEKDEGAEKRMSFLEAMMEHAYSGIR